MDFFQPYFSRERQRTIFLRQDMMWPNKRTVDNTIIPTIGHDLSIMTTALLSDQPWSEMVRVTPAPRAFQTLSGSYAGGCAERSRSVDWSSRCGHGRPLGKLAVSQKLETTSDCNPQKTILRDLSSMILLCHALPGHSSDASYPCDGTVQEATALKVYLLLQSFAKNHEKPGVRHSSRAVLLASVYEFTGFGLQNPSRIS